MPYEGSLEPSLERIADTPDSNAYREEGRIISIQSSWGSLTLEPGGQVELSGNPHSSLAAVRDEAVAFHDAVDRAVGPQWTQVALGYTPFTNLDDIQWVPKGRYVVMREHLARTGSLAHNMMKGTCATQASFDFSDEEDCAHKVAVASAIAPIVLALSANSPYTGGRPNGYMSFRGNIWLHTDPTRTGLPDAAEHFSFARWVDYLLDVPLLFRRDAKGRWLPGGKDATFRAWMEDATGPANRGDWNLHQTSIFPEVRVKGQIEVRSPDSAPLPSAMAIVALYTALLYDRAARTEVSEWAQTWWNTGERRSAMDAAARHGLRGTLHGVPALELARTLVGIARGGLERLGQTDEDWLAPLTASIDTGSCPARLLLARCGENPNVDDILAHCKYLPVAS